MLLNLHNQNARLESDRAYLDNDWTLQENFRWEIFQHNVTEEFACTDHKMKVAGGQWTVQKSITKRVRKDWSKVLESGLTYRWKTKRGDRWASTKSTETSKTWSSSHFELFASVFGSALKNQYWVHVLGHGKIEIFKY